MITEYLYEIIALAALLIVTIIYLIVKSKSTQKDETKEEYVQEMDTVEVLDETPKDTEEAQELLITEEVIEDLAGTEEGDFGQQTVHKEEVAPAKVIYKRNVPTHGKITKQNFKEFAGTRILIAEDNLINQKVLTGLLADSGIELVLADDGKEALDILEKDDNFLMVLMDAHMPRIDGFEATRSIRANPKYNHIVVVALSGDTAADDIKKMREAGMAEQLEKPLRMEALYDVIYSYSGEKKQDESEYVDVIMTAQLNGDKGLSICGGDENFYMEILNEFVETYSDSATKLQELLKDEKLQEADKLLLDIIGISANIGADPLHTIANDLKDALNDTEKSYLTIAEQYQSLLDALLQDIHEYKTL